MQTTKQRSANLSSQWPPVLTQATAIKLNNLAEVLKQFKKVAAQLARRVATAPQQQQESVMSLASSMPGPFSTQTSRAASWQASAVAPPLDMTVTPSVTTVSANAAFRSTTASTDLSVSTSLMSDIDLDAAISADEDASARNDAPPTRPAAQQRAEQQVPQSETEPAAAVHAHAAIQQVVDGVQAQVCLPGACTLIKVPVAYCFLSLRICTCIQSSMLWFAFSCHLS